MIKRMIEAILAFILCLFLAPWMVVIALAIKINSKGPVIFRQQRVGVGGRIFTLYKFRTMYTNSDPLGVSPSGLSDSRITGVGRWLRKFALDEWPQFFNILKGDMSFVGPRPQLSNELAELKEQYPDLYKKRLTVRPGLTCTWAITPGAVKIKPTEEMLQEDCNYVDTASMWQDVKILFRTLLYLLDFNRNPVRIGGKQS